MHEIPGRQSDGSTQNAAEKFLQSVAEAPFLPEDPFRPKFEWRDVATWQEADRSLRQLESILAASSSLARWMSRDTGRVAERLAVSSDHAEERREFETRSAAEQLAKQLAQSPFYAAYLADYTPDELEQQLADEWRLAAESGDREAVERLREQVSRVHEAGERQLDELFRREHPEGASRAWPKRLAYQTLAENPRLYEQEREPGSEHQELANAADSLRDFLPKIGTDGQLVDPEPGLAQQYMDNMAAYFARSPIYAHYVRQGMSPIELKRRLRHEFQAAFDMGETGLDALEAAAQGESEAVLGAWARRARKDE